MEGVRLRIVPTVLFSALTVFAFGAAMPVPSGDVAAQILPMLPLAAIGIACAAFLALFAHPAVTAVLVPLSAAAAWLLGGDLLSACFTAALFLPVLGLRRMLAAKQAATPTLLCLAALCGAVWLPEVYLALGRAWGIWAPGAMLDRVMAGLAATLQAVEIPVGGETMGYSAAQANEIVALFNAMLPALTLLLCAGMAWLSWRLLRLLFTMHGLAPLFTPAMSTITVSRIGAVLFLVAAIAAMFGGDELGAAEALALNLVLLLEPPFVLVGVDGIFTALRRRETINGPTLALVVLMLVSCNVSILLLILALLGVIRTFRRKPAAE